MDEWADQALQKIDQVYQNLQSEDPQRRREGVQQIEALQAEVTQHFATWMRVAQALRLLQQQAPIQAQQENLQLPEEVRFLVHGPPQVVDTFRKGLGYYEFGLLPQARRALEKAVNLAPHFPLGHLYLGIVAYHMGDLQCAIPSLEQAIRQETSSLVKAVTLCWLAIARSQAGQIEEAEADLHRAQALQPTLMQINFNLGVLLFQQGAYEEAANAFRNAMEQDPQDAQAMGCYALSLEAMGEARAARVVMEQLQHTFAQQPDVQLEVALFYEHRGEDEQAQQAYRRVLRYEPASAVALNNLGLHALVAQRYNESRALLLKAYLVDPKNPRILVNLGWNTLAMGQYKQALQIFMATFQAPQTKVRRLGLQGYLRSLWEVDPKQAEHVTQAILQQSHSEVCFAIYEQGIALLRRKRYNEAYQTFSRVFRSDEPNWSVYLFAGFSALLAGDLAGFTEHLKEAIRAAERCFADNVVERRA